MFLGLMLGALGALGLTACGAARTSATPGNFTLVQARRFAAFPLSYAGDRVDGLALVAVLRRNDTANYVSFVYGDCTTGDVEQSCAPPAEIQVWPTSARNVDAYKVGAPEAPVPQRTVIRGLPAALIGTGHLEIYAARATVVVFAGSRERVLVVAAALRCLTAANPAAPGSGELGGTLDC